MSRLLLIPLLVAGIFLSGCKLGQQGSAGPNAPLADRIQDAWCNSCQQSEQWVENHPWARSTVYVTCFVGVAAAIAAGVAAYLLLENCGHH